MSLDGFIAGPNGEYDWIPMDSDIDMVDMFAGYDLFLMGRKTYETALSQGEQNPLRGQNVVVVSRTLRQEDHPDVRILASDIEAEIARLKQLPGKDIWLFGGGVLFRSLLDAGLVDSVEVGLIPHLLGGGIPLVPPGGAKKLKLAKHSHYPKSGILMLHYDVQ